MERYSHLLPWLHFSSQVGSQSGRQASLSGDCEDIEASALSLLGHSKLLPLDCHLVPNRKLVDLNWGKRGLQKTGQMQAGSPFLFALENELPAFHPKPTAL